MKRSEAERLKTEIGVFVLRLTLLVLSGGDKKQGEVLGSELREVIDSMVDDESC